MVLEAESEFGVGLILTVRVLALHRLLVLGWRFLAPPVRVHRAQHVPCWHERLAAVKGASARTPPVIGTECLAFFYDIPAT